jgi:hypothetical protein
MTEAKWLKKADAPYAMMNFLGGRVNRRKAQLFACGCFRHPKQNLESWELQIIEVAERAADGVATEAEVQEAERRSVGASGVAWVVLTKDYWTAVEAARAAGEWEHESLQSDLVRDIFGNPFRPVAFDPSWRTDTTVSLARVMYETRDFGAMPILADALQDAGCEHADILDHCRDPNGVHVRGCWVVDLVLGKL